MQQPPDRLPLAALENAEEAQRGGGTPPKKWGHEDPRCAVTPSPSKQGLTPESVRRNAQAVLAALDQVSTRDCLWMSNSWHQRL